MLTSFVKLRRRRRRASRRVSFKSIEIKEKISEKYGRGSDTQQKQEEYPRNKNISIMTDDEPDLFVSKPFVGTRPSNKTSLNEYVIVNAEEKFLRAKSGEILVKSNDASEKIMDDYVIVGTEEVPVTPIASDNSDSESMKSMEQPLKNCSLMCNHIWYPQFKRYVLKNLRNKIYPSVVTG